MYEAGMYQQQGFTKRSVTDFYKALEIFVKLRDTFNVAKIEQQIALSLVSAKKYDSAITIFKKSLSVYEKYSRKEEIVNVKNHIGQIQLKQKKVNDALGTLNSALQLSEKIGYKYGQKKALHNIGLAEKERMNWDRATQFFQASLALDEAMQDKYGIALNHHSIISILIAQNKFPEANTLGLKAYREARFVMAYELMDSIIGQLILINRFQGNANQIIQWQDSLLMVEKM
ncbi:MAG: hypothetical protein FD183_1479, partial [Chitinophagaceae bacterium]